MMPKISVIVPAYNATATLPDCLTALFDQINVPAPFEVLVIDDGSNDDTAEVARRFPVTLLQQLHAGPAAARNRGLQAARGELVFFTDADCVPAANWLATMTEPFATSAVVGCRGVYVTRQTALMARFVQLEYEVKYQVAAHSETIDFVDTYSAGYRRSTLLAAGGFDPTFLAASVEDAELAFRLSALGYRLVFNPAARVWHQHPHALLTYLRRKARYGFWRARLYAHYPAKLKGDSHTPRTMWWQLPLACTLLLMMGVSMLWPVVAWAFVGLALLFHLTCWPFIYRAGQQKQFDLALVTPILLWLRALTLAGGLLVGTIQLSLIPESSRILLSHLLTQINCLRLNKVKLSTKNRAQPPFGTKVH